MILSDDQIEQITRRRRAAAQIKQLRALGIPYRLRTDGSIVVFEQDIAAQAGPRGKPAPALRPLPTPIRARG